MAVIFLSSSFAYAAFAHVACCMPDGIPIWTFTGFHKPTFIVELKPVALILPSLGVIGPIRL